MNVEPTYIFRNGKTYAMVDNKIVAALDGDDVDELERTLQEEGVPADVRHTHIITPNGVKGQILGRVKDVWGEEVTVRLENGRIVHLPVTGKLHFATEVDEADEDLLETLKGELEQPTDGTRAAMAERRQTLANLRVAAAGEIGKGVGRDKELNSIIVQADFEMAELADSIRHLDSEEAEAFTAPKPYRMEVAPQNGPDLGGDSFLDEPYNEMLAESENTNFGQLMDEGPEAFVADIDTPALHDAGAVRSMASSYIRTRTAMADLDLRAKYEKVWLERVEQIRRAQVVARKELVKKEAAANEIDVDQYPDSSLFT